MEFRVQNEGQLSGVAKEILHNFSAKIFLFKGNLGAGKTTLIKQLCRELGSSDDFSSPTFALVNEYQTGDYQPIYHFDFYRIESVEEAMDIGFEEYIDSGHFCFIEWPEKIMKLIYGKYVVVEIKADFQSRIINVNLS